MILSCSNLSVADRVRTVLRRFDFAIGPGEIRTLIGPNGSGKSTALQALAGLLTPGDGTVTVDGRPIATMRRRDLARRLAFLPQQPSAPDEMTVEHLVRHGRFAHVRLFRNDRAAEAAAIRWALDSTGLWTLAGRSLRELSGGERQRAWISTAIAQEARILLLDEPTSFLDIGHQVESSTSSTGSAGSGASPWSWPSTTSTRPWRSAMGSPCSTRDASSTTALPDRSPARA